MANICHNRMEILGNNKEIQKFVDVCFDGSLPQQEDEAVLTYEKLVPPPEDTIKKQWEFCGRKRLSLEEGKNHWKSPLYIWKEKNYGDSGEPFSVTVYQKKGGIVIGFDCRYYPPIDWFRKTAIRFPGLQLELYYFGYEYGIVGCEKWLGGNQIFWKYADSSPEWEKLMTKYFNYTEITV